MRVIGIDPGSRICGWGIVEESGGPSTLVHVDSGAVFTDSKKPLADRLQHVYDELRAVIHRFQPQEASIEEVFHHKNARSALTLGQARGVAVLACVHEGLSVYEYSPLQIKQAVSGYGRADKEQVAAMVKALLHLPEVAWEDTSDALAGAICHLNSYRLARASRRLTDEGR